MLKKCCRAWGLRNVQSLLFAGTILVIAATSAWAQGGVDLSGFEEYKPDVKSTAESKPEPKAKAADPLPDFETITPAQAARKPTPKAAPLERSNIRPAPAVVGQPAPRAPVDLPSPQATSKQAQRRTTFSSNTKLPKGISTDPKYQEQIRGLNQEISVLKERVIEAKSRLLSYSQKVAQGFASGTQLFMKVHSKLGRDFEIERMAFFLDGHQIYTREFEPGEKVGELLAYKGSVLPGRHRIDVDAIVRGDDGILDFGFKARLRLESGEYFAANEGKVVDLDLVLFDRGGLFKAIESRPGLKFEIVERDAF